MSIGLGIFRLGFLENAFSSAKMEILSWNCHGLIPEKANQVRTQVLSRPKLAAVGIQEVMRNLDTDEMIIILEATFPSSDWITRYSKGSGPGKGLFTAVKVPKDKDCSAEITEFFDENGSQLHHVELTVDDFTYSMNNYYISPKTKEISIDFSNCLASSDISFGDLNRTDTSTTKFQKYTNIIESMDFQELLVENTCIPIRGNRPTTCPDSVLSSDKYNEEVDVLSHDTLTSDHLAVKISTDFPYFDEDRNVRTVYYDMQSITVEKIVEIWTTLPDQPSDAELAHVCSKLVLLGRRVSNGKRKKVEGIVETVDEYWAREMANDERKISDLKNIFEIEKKINSLVYPTRI